MNNPKPALRGVDIGLNLMVAVLLVGGAGYLADGYFATTPFLMLAGGFIGFCAWLWQVWQMLQNSRNKG